jgi:hypothetical protein
VAEPPIARAITPLVGLGGELAQPCFQRLAHEGGAVAAQLPRRPIGSPQQLLVEHDLHSLHWGAHSTVCSTTKFTASA